MINLVGESGLYKKKTHKFFSFRIILIQTHVIFVIRHKKHQKESSSIVIIMLLENFSGQMIFLKLISIMRMMLNRGIKVTYYMDWKGIEIALNKLIGDPDKFFGIFFFVLENG